MMALPNVKQKIKKKDGAYNLTFEDSIDAANYTMQELTRAALRDSAKYLRRLMGDQLKSFYGVNYIAYYHGKVFKANRTGKLIKKYPGSAVQYWVRKRECDLQIGFKQDSWYGMKQELGDKGQPKLGILRNTTYDNIDKIRTIQSQYLDGMNNEKPFDPGDDEYKSHEGEEE